MKNNILISLLLTTVLPLTTVSASCLKENTSQTNCGVHSGIPGIQIIDTWTWGGNGTIFLRRNNWSDWGNYVCYKSSGRCYFFDANLCFRQPGETQCGRRIYINTRLYDGGEVWLAGKGGGGIRVNVTSSLLPGEFGKFGSYQSVVPLKFSPLGWNY